MPVSPMYTHGANESGEPQDPLYWVLGYGWDDQEPITSYGGEPYRRATGVPLPPDPGSPGWTPDEGTGETAPPVPFPGGGWSQTDPGLTWGAVDPTIPWKEGPVDVSILDSYVHIYQDTPPSSGSYSGAYYNSISLASLTAEQAGLDTGWPAAANAQVMTVRTGPDTCAQFFFNGSTENSSAWYRELHTADAGPWVQFTGQNPYATVLIAPIASALPATSYPLGFTAFYLTSAQAAADGGWPTTDAATVVTYVASAVHGVQFWFKDDTATPTVYFRTLVNAVKSSWIPLSGNNYTTILAADSVSSGWGSTHFPTGISLCAISLTQSQADGAWPTTGSLMVMTMKATGTIAYQYAYQNSAPNVWFRTLGSADPPVAPWNIVAEDHSYCAQYNTAAQNVPNATWTLLSITTDEYSYGTGVTKSGSGMQVHLDGLYEISANVAWDSGINNNSLMIGLAVLSGSGADGFYRSQVANTGGVGVIQNGTWFRKMQAGDTVGVWALQSDGATHTVSNRRMVMRRVGPHPG